MTVIPVNADPRWTFHTLACAYEYAADQGLSVEDCLLPYPYFTLKPLATAIPEIADLFHPVSRHLLPIQPAWNWGRRWFGRISGAEQRERAAVVLITHVTRPRPFKAMVDCFVTVYDSDGHRVDMRYLRRGDRFVLDAADGYIVNVAIGSTDGGDRGIELRGAVGSLA